MRQSSAAPLALKPFLKWAGGKRWLVGSTHFAVPDFPGRYIEPFLGGGAVYFHLQPPKALLSDRNERLVEVYKVVRDNPEMLSRELRDLQAKHSQKFYYEERARKRLKSHTRAAQFIYLNRTCWNGLYRENRKGQFNVPIGTKSAIYDKSENWRALSRLLSGADLAAADFEQTVDKADKGDFIFADPPYTTAHNNNGFVKYNQDIFSWGDQERLRDALVRAVRRGVKVMLTNADHDSIHNLFDNEFDYISISRSSVISGSRSGRGMTSEALYLSKNW
ncbi:MAG: DNA methyltransferase [Sphingomonadales bacterium CG12_big_fil_rev_8_21_14_0_65_65_10]|nr:MAG: DNA methyltransferase [Sphingomonadales bacterium CG12_big_fil_rev_8_21_14_0_65_65_10]